METREIRVRMTPAQHKRREQLLLRERWHRRFILFYHWTMRLPERTLRVIGTTMVCLFVCCILAGAVMFGLAFFGLAFRFCWSRFVGPIG